MAAAPGILASLRHRLAERFSTLPRTDGRVLPTSLPALDEAAGRLPLGAVTKLICAVPNYGGQLCLDQLFAITRSALVNDADSFDPSSHPADLPRRFRPPLPARPEFTDGRAMYLGTGSPRREIVQRSTTWPASGEWWQADRTGRRTEWDIALADGGLYRLLRVGDARFIEGEYD